MNAVKHSILNMTKFTVVASNWKKKKKQQQQTSMGSNLVIFCTFPRYISRGLDWKWTTQDFNQHPYGMVGVLDVGLSW